MESHARAGPTGCRPWPRSRSSGPRSTLSPLFPAEPTPFRLPNLTSLCSFHHRPLAAPARSSLPQGLCTCHSLCHLRSFSGSAVPPDFGLISIVISQRGLTWPLSHSGSCPLPLCIIHAVSSSLENVVRLSPLCLLLCCLPVPAGCERMSLVTCFASFTMESPVTFSVAGT